MKNIKVIIEVAISKELPENIKELIKARQKDFENQIKEILFDFRS
jgi:hypothetical protein